MKTTTTIEKTHKSPFSKYFGEEHIDFIIEEETGWNKEDLKMVEGLLDNKILTLQNAIGFLSDFYDNDTEDDDPTLEDRRPIIKQTLNRLCMMLVAERNQETPQEKEMRETYAI